MDDKQLALQATKGDADAFCRLYEKYRKKMYNYACYKLGNCADAEDAVQDAVLTAFENIHKLKHPEAFYSWIFKILYFSCNNAVRIQQNRRSTADIDDYINTVASESIMYERQELCQALMLLKEEDRSIVLLSVTAGLSSKEISKINGMSAGNVRQRLSRSLAKLRRYLDN